MIPEYFDAADPESHGDVHAAREATDVRFEAVAAADSENEPLLLCVTGLDDPPDHGGGA
ncbi:hypothetical protein EHYA_05560 [Embleya hyalina]|uniref:Uncharacterized protein n=1 Tax=Embleya hyalina TaxID=516124 RepID=A0A401YTB7_9ACTN|nr:hypothetical protein EHYA_05560 [Embleya hyalina]